MQRKRILVPLLVASLILLGFPASGAPVIEEYIVVLRPTGTTVSGVANEIASAHGGSVGFVYSEALEGFTLTLPSSAVAGLSRNPLVQYIEPVQAVFATGTQQIPTGIDRVDADVNPPTLPMDVDVAVLDTGVYIGRNPDGSARSHLDLNLRFISDCTGAIFYPLFGGCTSGGNPQDEHGHGTHVAGILGALDNDIGSIGTAPGATIWSFKVLDASGAGTTGTILAGIDSVAGLDDRIEVANMSLGFEGTSQALNDAIANATDRGIVFVVAAGNSSIPAENFSPASSPDVITVSAIADFDGLPGGLGSPTCRADVDDTLADFSNFGSAVEIAAPGVCIFSTFLNDGYTTFSGTSMASPFVAGAVARYIAESGLDPQSRADVTAIRNAIVGAGTPQGSACGFVDIDSDQEPLLFINSSLFGGNGSCGGTVIPGDNTAPEVSFDWNCVGLDCFFDATATDSDGDTLSYAWDFGDGGSSSVEDPSHGYGAGGDYEVTLTVDDGTDLTVVVDTVTVTAPGANNPPMGSFDWTCVDLDCSFDSTATDADGDLLTYTWDFGDGGSSAAEDPSHIYGSGGDYLVTLTVDDGTDQTLVSQTVSVDDPATGTPLATAVVAPILLVDRNLEIEISVIDADGIGIAGADVAGEWSYVDKQGRVKTIQASGTTDQTGSVLLTRRPLSGATDYSFCLTDVVAPGHDFVMPPISCGFVLD
jgi:subtilisin family serine protease